jgi:hypothetical protein
MEARRLKWLLLLGCLASLTALLAFLRTHPDPNFWLVPGLPVPSYAMHVERSGRPLYDGPLGGYRILQFETDRPAAEIQGFYRAELSRLGWHFLCSPTQLEQPGCPLGLSLGVEWAEAYRRNDEPAKVRAVDVSVYQPGEGLAARGHRRVEVIEYRYPLATPAGP